MIEVDQDETLHIVELRVDLVIVHHFGQAERYTGEPRLEDVSEDAVV